MLLAQNVFLVKQKYVYFGEKILFLMGNQKWQKNLIWKSPKMAVFPNPIFHDQKFFLQKNFLVMKNWLLKPKPFEIGIMKKWGGQKRPFLPPPKTPSHRKNYLTYEDEVVFGDRHT